MLNGQQAELRPKPFNKRHDHSKQVLSDGAKYLPSLSGVLTSPVLTPCPRLHSHLKTSRLIVIGWSNTGHSTGLQLAKSTLILRECLSVELCCSSLASSWLQGETDPTPAPPSPPKKSKEKLHLASRYPEGFTLHRSTNMAREGLRRPRVLTFQRSLHVE